MIKTEKRDIDGITYTLQQMPAKRGNRMGYRLFGIVGPALTKAFGGNGLPKSLGQVDMSALGGAIEMLYEKLPPADFDAVAEELLYSLKKGGKPMAPSSPDFDIEMAGMTFTYFRLLYFAFEVNFPDFFDAWRANSAKVAQKRAEAEEAAKAVLAQALSLPASTT